MLDLRTRTGSRLSRSRRSMPWSASIQVRSVASLPSKGRVKGTWRSRSDARSASADVPVVAPTRSGGTAPIAWLCPSTLAMAPLPLSKGSASPAAGGGQFCNTAMIVAAVPEARPPASQRDLSPAGLTKASRSSRSCMARSSLVSSRLSSDPMWPECAMPSAPAAAGPRPSARVCHRRWTASSLSARHMSRRSARPRRPCWSCSPCNCPPSPRPPVPPCAPSTSSSESTTRAWFTIRQKRHNGPSRSGCASAPLAPAPPRAAASARTCAQSVGARGVCPKVRADRVCTLEAGPELLGMPPARAGSVRGVPWLRRRQ
mmetsp:Transcript_5252/g.15374  ORF Transcript_5252/g.15374 Transcript_5252/m.15374 type:complete len:316 (-) Transcript_5252:1740-2687(-)